MAIVTKLDILEKIVNLAALVSSFYTNDGDLVQDIKKNLEIGKINDNQIEEILEIVKKADKQSFETFTTILKDY